MEDEQSGLKEAGGTKVNLAEGSVELAAELIGSGLFQLVFGELGSVDFINIPTLFKFRRCILNFSRLLDEYIKNKFGPLEI